MRVLLMTLEYPPFFGGVANYYANLAANWPEHGLLRVIDNSRQELVDEQRRYLKWWPAIQTLRKQCQAKTFDHLLVGQILPVGIAAYYLKYLFKFDYSVILHGMDFTYALKTERKKKMAAKILKQAKQIICANSYTARKVEEFLGQGAEGKIFVVNPGIDPNSFEVANEQRLAELKEQFGITNQFVLLTMGRLVKRKGVDQTILALARLADRWPDIVYLVAGSGPDEAYIKSYAESLSGNFSRVIKFIGSPSEMDKWQLLYLADVLVMPAREIDGDYEGFGIVYLEAGLASKPVIAGLAGGVGDAVENEVNGLLVNPLDSVQIAQAIKELMDRPELAHKLGKAGRTRVEKLFMWKDQAEKFYRILN